MRKGLKYIHTSVVSNKPVLGLRPREQPLLCRVSVSGRWKVEGTVPSLSAGSWLSRRCPERSGAKPQPTLHPLQPRGEGRAGRSRRSTSVNLEEISALSSERLRRDCTMSRRSPSPPPPRHPGPSPTRFVPAPDLLSANPLDIFVARISWL